jgi:hypothetical protein
MQWGSQLNGVMNLLHGLGTRCQWLQDAHFSFPICSPSNLNVCRPCVRWSTDLMWQAGSNDLSRHELRLDGGHVGMVGRSEIKMGRRWMMR